MHGGAAPQVKRKAREVMLALRDKAMEKLEAALDQGEVLPPTMLATAKDMHGMVVQADDHEAASGAGSVVDEWLADLRKSGT